MKDFFKRAMLALFGVFLALGFTATPALADTSQYAKSLELTGLASGETVQVYKLMSYGTDYNTYEFDDTTTGGKTSFKAYLHAAAQKASKGDEAYLASLSTSSTPTISSFLGTYLYGTETYAKPTPSDTTVADGATSVRLTLEPGYYLVSIKTVDTQEGSNVYNPFSVFVKMDGESSTIKAGDAQESKESSVTVQMKSSKGPSITNKVMRANGTSMDSSWKSTKTVTIGETILHRVALTIPDWQAGTTPRLELEVALANQQYVSGSVKLYSQVGDGHTQYKPTEQIEQAISEGTVGTYTNGSQNATFSIDYSKLTGSGERTYYITYETTVMSDITGTANAGVATAATSTDKVKYSTSDASYSYTTEQTTTLYTYAAKLTKKDLNGDLLSGSKFKVYEGNSGTPMTFEKVKTGETSWYYRPSTTGDITDIEAGGSECYLLIKGLDPYKDYYFEESTTPKGYYAPAGKFKLDLASQMDTADETEHSGNLSKDSTVTAVETADENLVEGTVNTTYSRQFDIVVKNSSTPSLPTTGGMGTVIFTVVGVALMAGAAGFVIVRRKRD